MRERVKLHGGELRAGTRAERRLRSPRRRSRCHDHRPDRRRPGARARRLPADPRARRARGGGGGRRRRRGARARPPPDARRRADGRPHAEHGRHRGDAPDRARRPADHACSCSPPSTSTSTSTRRCGRAPAASCSRTSTARGWSRRWSRSPRGESLVAPTVLERLVTHYVERPPTGLTQPDFLETCRPASSRCSSSWAGASPTARSPRSSSSRSRRSRRTCATCCRS